MARHATPPSRDFHVDYRIGSEGESREWDAAVAIVATRQHGVIEHRQLVAIGLSERAIYRRIEAGRLHPLHRGVYAVGHRRISREGRYLAAVLFAGDGAVLSHCAAADLWELRATKERSIDVIVPCNRRGDDVVRIRQHALEPNETTKRQGVPVTTPLRTLVDLAASVEPAELERAIRQAVYQRLSTTAALADAVQHHAGKRGMKSLRRALVGLGEAPGLTRSELEDRFVRFLRKHRLPMPRLNVPMRIGDGKIEADCVWQEPRLIVELDGRAAHDSTPGFESDRARDAALTAAGWRVVRITSRRLRVDSVALARELRLLTATT